MNATACPLENQTVEDEKLGKINGTFGADGHQGQTHWHPVKVPYWYLPGTIC